jgi:hypothetical protein
MFRLHQHFEAPVVNDIPGTVRHEIERLNLHRKVKRGETVAISAGSRGVANVHVITRAIVDTLKQLGARPFIVPAMGSHGGGTAEGQAAVLAHYGITEETMGVPVNASMEVVHVGTTEDGIPVYFDRYASEADHVVVCNRVKPHTNFRGEIESGLMKMMMIGLGKHKGATIYHQAIVHHTFDRIIRTVGRMVIAKCHVLCGVATIENGYDQTAKIVAVEPERFEEVEKELLVLAKRWMPKLPFDDIDLLIVDEIGKDISGAGLDTNVIGRKSNDHASAPGEKPRITRIFVRDLTTHTEGNAVGIGMADYTTKRLVEKMDRKKTYINAVTGNHPTSGSIPIYYDTDREALDVALGTIGLIPPEKARILWIKNTLQVGEVEASEAFLRELDGRDDIEIIVSPREMAFDEEGNLVPLKFIIERA